MSDMFSPFTSEEIAPSVPGPTFLTESVTAAPPEPLAPGTYDIEDIVRTLALDRRLRLDIPKHMKHPNWEYRFINDIPGNLSKWEAFGFRRVTHEELVSLYRDLHGGVTKDGRAYGPILMARPKEIGARVRARFRQMYSELMQAMDPRNRQMDNMPAGAFVDPSQSGLSHAGFGSANGQLSADVRERLAASQKFAADRAATLTRTGGTL